MEGHKEVRLHCIVRIFDVPHIFKLIFSIWLSKLTVKKTWGCGESDQVQFQNNHMWAKKLWNFWFSNFYISLEVYDKANEGLCHAFPHQSGNWKSWFCEAIWKDDVTCVGDCKFKLEVSYPSLMWICKHCIFSTLLSPYDKKPNGRSWMEFEPMTFWSLVQMS